MVGRIILARNESSAGALCCGRLCRDGCFLSAAGGGPRDGLLLGLFVDGLRDEAEVGSALAAARLGGLDWLRACVAVLGWELPDARLRDCLPVGG